MATYTTAAGAEAGLLANLDYEETGSLAKAKATISAGRAWLILRPVSAADQSSSLTLSHSEVRAIIEDARRYVASNVSTSASTTGVRFLSTNEGFRR